ncbi:hypothetical protein ACIMS1_005264 [Vibrio harveyi]
MFSIDLVEIWKIKRGRSAKQTAQYLENLAQEATELAEIWQAIVQGIVSNCPVEKKTTLGLQAFLDSESDLKVCTMCNIRQISRLERFYRDLSQVFPPSQTEELNSVLLHISNLLLSRSKMRRVLNLDRDCSNQGIASIEILTTTVESMHREAAELYAFSEKYKVLNN